jgi:hypothetical protein
MYNRYEGNTGRVRRENEGNTRQERHMPPPPRRQPPPPPPKGGSILDGLGGLLPKKLEGIETEDLLLLLILYLMYRDSGDRELLIIMGAMFLL